MSKYTKEMVSKMREAQPLNLEKAKELAAEFGLSYRSVIAKANNLGLDYQKKVRGTKRTQTNETKKDLVRAIERALDGESLNGLEGATRQSLSARLMSIR